jgi:glutathione synthase/RimK-type ligase-like ATP-grasp enzyme
MSRSEPSVSMRIRPARRSSSRSARRGRVGADLVGVDLLPIEGDGWAVIELNGAVEFNDEYSLGGDVFAWR